MTRCCSAGSAASAARTRPRSWRRAADSDGRGSGSRCGSDAIARTALSARPRWRNRSMARLRTIAATQAAGAPRSARYSEARRQISTNVSCKTSSASSADPSTRIAIAIALPATAS